MKQAMYVPVYPYEPWEALVRQIFVTLLYRRLQDIAVSGWLVLDLFAYSFDGTVAN